MMLPLFIEWANRIFATKLGERPRIYIPNTTGNKVFVTVGEISISTGDDKVVVSAPAMRGDKVGENGELSVLVVG